MAERYHEATAAAGAEHVEAVVYWLHHKPQRKLVRNQPLWSHNKAIIALQGPSAFLLKEGTWLTIRF